MVPTSFSLLLQPPDDNLACGKLSVWRFYRTSVKVATHWFLSNFCPTTETSSSVRSIFLCRRTFPPVSALHYHLLFLYTSIGIVSELVLQKLKQKYGDRLDLPLVLFKHNPLRLSVAHRLHGYGMSSGWQSESPQHANERLINDDNNNMLMESWMLRCLFLYIHINTCIYFAKGNVLGSLLPSSPAQALRQGAALQSIPSSANDSAAYCYPRYSDPTPRCRLSKRKTFWQPRMKQPKTSCPRYATSAMRRM
ncbi:hypothetical protein EJ03DRAFT_199938 [Teratosphaeria nubilosa]|uniref:Uncharacterized protein n=1 Tax=Teratosphaeria nubilosa TaxID=161662 RepID=A0A6G1KYE5_9PEZI|nr:hypothetical protein EJ03DRAFT_199938 [Teratosphaeria nubilosa]